MRILTRKISIKTCVIYYLLNFQVKVIYKWKMFNFIGICYGFPPSNWLLIKQGTKKSHINHYYRTWEKTLSNLWCMYFTYTYYIHLLSGYLLVAGFNS